MYRSFKPSYYDDLEMCIELYGFEYDSEMDSWYAESPSPEGGHLVLREDRERNELTLSEFTPTKEFSYPTTDSAIRLLMELFEPEYFEDLDD